MQLQHMTKQQRLVALPVASNAGACDAQHRPKRRGPLSERRQALSLGCSERTAASSAGLLEGLGQIGLPQRRRTRLRVAVDVDEVLGRFVHALNQYCKEEHDMDLEVQDYYIYEFAKIWNCTQDMSNHIVHSFFQSPHFAKGIPVIPGAYESLCRLQRHCDLVVVTSRQHIIQDMTREWLDRHYPGLFSKVYFGNHFALHGTSRAKSDICKEVGASVLIDDNPGYALECAAAGINVLLYDWEHAYPWSKLPSGSNHPRISVVKNWGEVEHAVMAMAERQ